MSAGAYSYRENGCMPACAAAMLGRPELSWSLPLAAGEGWLARFNQSLAVQADAFLAQIPLELLPWRHEQDWIAGVEVAGEPQALVAYQQFVAFDPDPSSELAPGDPLPEVTAGFLLLPYPRALRVARLQRLDRLVQAGLAIGGES